MHFVDLRVYRTYSTIWVPRTYRWVGHVQQCIDINYIRIRHRQALVLVCSRNCGLVNDTECVRYKALCFVYRFLCTDTESTYLCTVYACVQYVGMRLCVLCTTYYYYLLCTSQPM